MNSAKLQQLIKDALWVKEDAIRNSIVGKKRGIAFREAQIANGVNVDFNKKFLVSDRTELAILEQALSAEGRLKLQEELDRMKRGKANKKVAKFVEDDTVDLEKEIDEYRKVRFPPKGVAAKAEKMKQGIQMVADQEGRKLQRAGVKRAALNKFREKFVTKARKDLLSDIRSQVAFKKQVEEYRPRIQQRLARIRGAPEQKRVKSEGKERHIRNVARRARKAKKRVTYVLNPAYEGKEYKEAKEGKNNDVMKIGKNQKNISRQKIVKGRKYNCTKNQKERLASTWLQFVREYREEHNCPTYKEALQGASKLWIKAKHRK
jgi:hypothetical protein